MPGASGGRLAAAQRTRQRRPAQGQGSMHVRGQASKTQKCKEGKVSAWCACPQQGGHHLLPECGSSSQLTDIQ